MTAMVCALATESKASQERQGGTTRGGPDAGQFAELVNAMSETDAKILGDVYRGSIYGETGQYSTPEHVTDWPMAP